MESIMFKAGDIVRLNALGRSGQGLGNKEYIPNSCSQMLLVGKALEISHIRPVVEGSRHFSVCFFDGAYSFSEDYFECVL